MKFNYRKLLGQARGHHPRCNRASKTCDENKSGCSFDSTQSFNRNCLDLIHIGVCNVLRFKS
eukprot:3346555-Amphidinium_carterae.1